MTDEMVGRHHRLNGHEFEQAPGAGKGQAAWRAAVCGVAKSNIQLSNRTITAHSSILAWRSPRT